MSIQSIGGAARRVAAGALLLSLMTVSHAKTPQRPASPHQQLMSCMSTRMSASRALSYNDAAKMCKAQLAAAAPATAAAGGRIAANTGSKGAGGLGR